jgi:photoactive yellow protein
MPDPARDLYSFLRSKDFISSDEAAGGSSEHDAGEDGSGDGPRLRAVEDFDEDASSEAAPNDTGLAFDDDNLGTKLPDADADTLNSVDFGVIRVDDDGTVEFFNRYESELSGVDPDDAVGKNFFNELAPCSNNRLFRGRFKNGVRSGEMDERFTYTYTYKMRPTLVEVRLYRDQQGQNWIFVQKR